MKKTTILSIASFALLSLSSCDKNYHEVFAPDELGMETHEYIVGEAGGNVDISFLSNRPGTISLMDPSDGAWLTLGATSFGNDGVIPVSVKSNDGFKRRADILFSSDTRKDTVSVMQRGPVEEKFYVAAGSMVVYNGKDELNTIVTDINVPLDRIKSEILFPGKDEWIKDGKLTAVSYTFKTTDNPDKLYMRRAYLLLSFLDGWKQTQTAKVTIVQARSDNHIGTKFTPEALRTVATVAGYTLPDDAYVEGYIVSTTQDHNAGDIIIEDLIQGTGVIDYDVTDCTSYLVGDDGKGFRLIAVSPSENDYTRNSQVSIGIGGAVVKKSADGPLCYTIEGVKSSETITSMDATHTMPRKEKSISELTDDDINTFVTIKDCEIPMRKGPFTPINEGYSTLHGYNRVAKYPVLVRDKTGGSMYMYINVTVPWRRDGNKMPYGSGPISGVIVSEQYKSFGTMSRYQIRPMTREDIALKDNFSDGFSALITEFRWMDIPGEFDTTELPGAIRATEGNGEMTHTYPDYSSNGVRFNNFSKSFFYLGPCGTKYKTISKGCGLTLPDGTDYKPWEGQESAQNDDGKGWVAAGIKLSWSNKYWWDDENNRGYAYLVAFSTEGVVSDKVSMQFAMYNNSGSLRSPRYWKVQYSLTTSSCAAADDSEWNDIGEFSVSDVVIWGNSGDGVREWQTTGTQVFDFPLPLEILGKEKVYIRLMPRNNRAGDANSPDGSTIKNNSGYNTMDYFAVRYNK